MSSQVTSSNCEWGSRSADSLSLMVPSNCLQFVTGHPHSYQPCLLWCCRQQRASADWNHISGNGCRIGSSRFGNTWRFWGSCMGRVGTSAEYNALVSTIQNCNFLQSNWSQSSPGATCRLATLKCESCSKVSCYGDVPDQFTLSYKKNNLVEGPPPFVKRGEW